MIPGSHSCLLVFFEDVGGFSFHKILIGRSIQDRIYSVDLEMPELLAMLYAGSLRAQEQYYENKDLKSVKVKIRIP